MRTSKSRGPVSAKNFRLSAEISAALGQLALLLGISQTKVVERAVSHFYLLHEKEVDPWQSALRAVVRDTVGVRPVSDDEDHGLAVTGGRPKRTPAP